MDVWLAINSVALGSLAAIVLIDFIHRAVVVRDLKKTKEQLGDSILKLQRLHNESAKEIVEMRDKVAAHDYQLTARITPQRPQAPFERKNI